MYTYNYEKIPIKIALKMNAGVRYLPRQHNKLFRVNQWS